MVRTIIFLAILISTLFTSAIHASTPTAEDGVIGRTSALQIKSSEEKKSSRIGPESTTPPVQVTLTSPRSNSAPAISPKTFVYFLDNFTATNIQAVPADFAIIGESEATGSNSRSTLTDSGRVVGTQTEFNQTSHIPWTTDLQALFNGSAPDLSTPTKRKAFAMQILVASGMSLDSSGTPGGGFPIAADNEWQPTSAGGYVLYTQDVEGPIGSVPQESAAAITAVMWASRVTLGPNMKIIPVPASALVKETAANWDFNSVLLGNSSNKYLTYLNLQNTLNATDAAALATNQIDLFSLLHLASAEGHPLIDGILAQQYSIHDAGTPPGMVNCGAPPGSFSTDTPAFYDTSLPYSMLSAHDNPAQLFIDTNPNCQNFAQPWESYHHESMPFLAGVYWSGAVDPAGTFDPSNYLVPTVTSTNTICTGDTDNSGTVDSIDMLAVISAWGPCEGCNEDIDGNNNIDVHDLLALFSAWGECPLGTTSPSWVSVLIAQYAPPASNAEQEIYVNKIKKLAPNLEQIHLRYLASELSTQTNQEFANLITLLRSAYGSTLQIGFHPDNSSSSCDPWGCANTGDCASTNPAAWHCVLDASIIAMNAINAIVDANHSGTGFTIFSIEQSYIEDVGGSLQSIKHTLSGGANPIAGVTLASPTVKFGTVGPSYGGPNVYGPDAFDFGYPQYYNLCKSLVGEACSLYQGSNPYFPVASAQDCLPSSLPCPPATLQHILVVDVDTPGSYPAPKIPCFNNGSLVQNVYTSLPDGSAGASPTLVAAYLGYLMTQLPPISNTVPLNGSEVFITLSGEPELLGSTGWTIENINELNSQLVANFATLQSQVPSLFPSGGTDPTTLKYGIWNFDAILENIPLP
jgi:hypothetical protein